MKKYNKFTKLVDDDICNNEHLSFSAESLIYSFGPSSTPDETLKY